MPSRSIRQILGLPTGGRVSDRIQALATQLRARAAAVDDRFGREAPPMSEMQRTDVADLNRVAGLRGFRNVQDAVRLLDSRDAMALRSTAEELDRFAMSMRGKPTPYHLTRYQLIVAVAGIAILAGGGLFFIRTDVEQGFLFNFGRILVVLALIASVIVYLMHSERD